MVIGVFRRHGIANSSPAGRDQTSSLLSRRTLFMASTCPPCWDGTQRAPISHASQALNSQRVWPGRRRRGTRLRRDAAVRRRNFWGEESIEIKHARDLDSEVENYVCSIPPHRFDIDASKINRTIFYLPSTSHTSHIKRLQ